MDRDVPDSKAQLFVSNSIRNGTWNIDNIRHLLPSYICDLILATPLSHNADQEDFIIWYGTKDGKFSIKSAYFTTLPSISTTCTHTGSYFCNSL